MKPFSNDENQFIGLGAIYPAPGVEPNPLDSPEWRPYTDEKDRLGCITTAPNTRVKAFVLATDGDPEKIDVWIVQSSEFGDDRAKVRGPCVLASYLSDVEHAPLPFGVVPRGTRFTVEIANRAEGWTCANGETTPVVTCGMICDELEVPRV